jgi:MoxR-like ATPase
MRPLGPIAILLALFIAAVPARPAGQQTLEIASKSGLEPVRDPSNADPGLFRARIRHDVLPVLRRAAGPGVVERLARFARSAAEDEELLQALEATDGTAPVLLIDEIDKADEEFEAYLLEILSDFQVTVPEIGTIRAERPPRVILTSNRTREVHDALKRRCLYHWVGYPSPEREVEIVLVRTPGVAEALARKVVAAVNRLRELDLAKPPGVAETLDWVATLQVLGEDDLDARSADDTLGAVVKERDDLDLVRERLEEIVSGA